VNKKGVAVAAFFGFILLTSTVMISLPGLMDPVNDDPEMTVTGTPADNYPDAQRAEFCGSSIAKSTNFVQEYSIPTVCTNPLAIVTDFDGNVWFAQTNTGNLAKFDPVSETFTEYDNPSWPPSGRSMMWGIDQASDGTLWYTDETFDSVWRFDPQTESYQRLPYPSEGNSLPQKIKVDGSQIIVNDFTGNKITFLDPTQSDDELSYLTLPSPLENAVTSDFTVDSEKNVWYTNWVFQQGGVLVKFDQEGYRTAVANTGEEFLPLGDFIEITTLPENMVAPNGAVLADGKIWIGDTASSNFYSFDIQSKSFVQYVTSDPPAPTYGNSTGIIKTPISRPYWVETNDLGHLVFNEQNANRLAVLDTKSETLVEYSVPSMNPNWGDCGEMQNCGLAQVFDFTVDGDLIWFTEWVENNIGVVDTSKELPLEIQLDTNTVTLNPGQTKEIVFVVSPTQQDISDVSLILSDSHDFLHLNPEPSVPKTFQLDFDAPRPIPTTLSISDDAVSGTYKVLLGAQTGEVAISKFLTVVIES
jgi:virginiamycin B lyase